MMTVISETPHAH